ncbi:DedA family protein [Paenibacillus thermoaerophilus]|nr:DedA family protein [Paenibacillus thermoaerophilus]
MDWILGVISVYRYWALFGLLGFGMVGLPVPDETLMTFAGYLTSLPKGAPAYLNYSATLAVCFAGSLSGMTVSYWIGRKLGRPFLDKYGRWVRLSEKRLRQAEAWFQRYGSWTVSFGYWVPGVRQFTCYIAGISRIPFGRYLAYAGGGALVWCVTFVTLGHIIGENWRAIMETIHAYAGWFAAAVTVLVAVAAAIWLRFFRRKLWG